MPRGVLIAAVDLGPQTQRVLYHAVGFARLFDLGLKILHVAKDASESEQECALNACLQQAPYHMSFSPDDVVVRSGRVSEAITREAQRERAALVVMGSRGHGGVASLVLGSTSEAVLRSATAPVLLVPPTHMDIVSVANSHAALTCGPIVAAVDLAEGCAEQLRMASELAYISGQPLILMTVARSRTTDEEAALELRQRAHGLEPRRPTSLIVRRGSVPEEIARCALVEGAGLVVMGLRVSPRGQPGTIAIALLRTHRAFVLAVPRG